MIPRLGDGNSLNHLRNLNGIEDGLENDSPSRGRKHGECVFTHLNSAFRK